MGREDKTTQFQARAARSVRQLRVTVVEGPDRGKVHQARPRRPITVGASGDNDLVLDDPQVSRYHLEIGLEIGHGQGQGRGRTGVEVVDLDSRNGTFLGSARLVRAIVQPGTRLTIGSTVLEVSEGGAAAAEASDDTPPRLTVPGLVGESEAITELAQLVHAVAPRAVPVLIEGETGTGKEVVAQAIHQLSPRRQGPFVVVDCGAMPATLIASELFGHERGAFTGADEPRAGAFELAGGGTLFLDEIGELPLAVQPTLLGALERRRYRRLGGRSAIAVDIRVVAATNRDLRAEANAETFRSDLYFRLAVARIKIQPLRERPEDIAPLVAHFVREHQGSVEPFPFSESTIEALRRQRWSGNVRELRNVVDAALAMGRVQLDGAAVDDGRDNGGGRAGSGGGLEPVRPYGEARKEVLEAFEARYLRNLIEVCEGNASAAARLALMDRPYLLSLLKKHRLR